MQGIFKFNFLASLTIPFHPDSQIGISEYAKS